MKFKISEMFKAAVAIGASFGLFIFLHKLKANGRRNGNKTIVNSDTSKNHDGDSAAKTSDMRNIPSDSQRTEIGTVFPMSQKRSKFTLFTVNDVYTMEPIEGKQ